VLRASQRRRRTYWKSVCLAIEENDILTSARLRCTPEMYHSEHMEVFEKKSLKVLRMLNYRFNIDYI